MMKLKQQQPVLTCRVPTEAVVQGQVAMEKPVSVVEMFEQHHSELQQLLQHEKEKIPYQP
jgi:hypothetical protein